MAKVEGKKLCDIDEEFTSVQKESHFSTQTNNKKPPTAITKQH